MDRSIPSLFWTAALAAFVVSCGGKKGGSDGGGEAPPPDISNENILQPESEEPNAGGAPVGPSVPNNPVPPLPPPPEVPPDTEPPPAGQAVRIHHSKGFVGLSFSTSVSQAFGLRAWSIGISPSIVSASGQAFSAKIAHFEVIRE